LTDTPVFHATTEEWRAWLGAHDAGARERRVGFHKRAAGRRIRPPARAS
jgi:hypothetical protein